MTTQELTFAESVFTRPKMYTINGTHGEVIAFLDGFCGGVARLKPDAPEVIEWYAFGVWLSRSLEASVTDVHARMGELYGTQAIAETLSQLRRFREEHRTGK